MVATDCLKTDVDFAAVHIVGIVNSAFKATEWWQYACRSGRDRGWKAYVWNVIDEAAQTKMFVRASEPDESGRLDANLVAMRDVVKTSGCRRSIFSTFLDGKEEAGSC